MAFYGQPDHVRFKVIYGQYGQSNLANSKAGSLPGTLQPEVRVRQGSSPGYDVIAYPSALAPARYRNKPYAGTQQTGGGGGAGGGGQGGAGTGGAGTSASAAGAVQANQPVVTGGGPGFDVGAVETQTVLQERGAEFTGVDQFMPDEKIPQGKSPHAINWNALEKPGSYCTRKGTARIVDDRTTCVNEASSGLSASVTGVSLMNIDLNDPSDSNAQNTAAVLYAFSDTAIGGTDTMNCCVVEPGPAWGDPATLISHPGPKVTLSSPSSNTLRVVVDYTNAFANSGVINTSVKGITIAYSTTSFPRDPDGKDARDAAGTTAAKSVTVHAPRDAWDGESVQYDISSLAVGDYYVTVWAHTLEGTSDPSYARLEIV